MTSRFALVLASQHQQQQQQQHQHSSSVAIDLTEEELDTKIRQRNQGVFGNSLGNNSNRSFQWGSTQAQTHPHLLTQAPLPATRDTLSSRWVSQDLLQHSTNNHQHNHKAQQQPQLQQQPSLHNNSRHHYQNDHHAHNHNDLVTFSPLALSEGHAFSDDVKTETYGESRHYRSIKRHKPQNWAYLSPNAAEFDMLWCEDDQLLHPFDSNSLATNGTSNTHSNPDSVTFQQQHPQQQNQELFFQDSPGNFKSRDITIQYTLESPALPSLAGVGGVSSVEGLPGNIVEERKRGGENTDPEPALDIQEKIRYIDVDDGTDATQRKSDGVKKAGVWRLGSPVRKSGQPAPEVDPDQVEKGSRWDDAGTRPYLVKKDREAFLQKLAGELEPTAIRELPGSTRFHVDFSEGEIDYLLRYARRFVNFKNPPFNKVRELLRIIHRRPECILDLSELKGKDVLKHRSYMDVYNFLTDVNSRHTNQHHPQILSVERDESNGEVGRSVQLAMLRMYREVSGMRSVGKYPRYVSAKMRTATLLEDNLAIRHEWSNCAGDIATISWVSPEAFICGTTTHSDSHNQQYNRPGNLLLGSFRHRTLKAFPDHRVPRPMVDKGENSTQAMRESQDPWLYSSVVASAHDPVTGLAYTSSFDRTVKVWKVDRQGRDMQCLATWGHEGHVNFVLPNGEFVATGVDAPDRAVRIYQLDPEDPNKSTFRSFGDRFGAVKGGAMIPGTGTRQEEDPKWGYFPATMQWGKAPGCKHHLLVGYSPRSVWGLDGMVPEAKANSGVIKIWDAVTGKQINLNFPLAQNVFEVVWHPTQMTFAVATSATTNAEARVKTQVRLWSYMEDPDGTGGDYHLKQTLDCYSADINEVTLMPNSAFYSYVTAATTDGRVYVWDTSQGDHPMHILRHGPSVEPLTNRAEDDTGVRFTLWGSTSDRLYTGGSDGVLRVWNVRNRKPFVRVLLEVAGPLMAGAFSADWRRLVVGDASGRVFLVTGDAGDESKGGFWVVRGEGGRMRRLRRPIPFIPHKEVRGPGPGDSDGDWGSGRKEEGAMMEGVLRARRAVERGQIVIDGNPLVGAGQGPLYAETGLYNLEAHIDGDPEGPLNEGYSRKPRGLVREIPVFRGIRETFPVRERGFLRGERVEKEDEWDEEVREQARREGWVTEWVWGVEYESEGEIVDKEEEEEEDMTMNDLF